MSFHKFTEAEVKALFEKFDTDHNQVIDPDEFECMLKDVLGKVPPKEECAKIFQEVDENHDGQITFLELKTAFMKSQ